MHFRRFHYGGEMEGRPHAYVLVAFCNNNARCQCGWAGRRRLLRGRAVLDVIEHSQTTGHMPIGGEPPYIREGAHRQAQ